MAVIIFGSINMDLVARTPYLPAPGETITGYGFSTVPGGKGANQAVAAVRLNSPTRMIGRVGDDNFGPELRRNLSQVGIDITAIATDAEVSSGIAIISVDDTGQNSIVYVPGANSRMGQADLDRLADSLAEARVVLLQLEIPLETTVAAARLARQTDLTVVLDPAPARELPEELYRLVDVITPNEVEAGQLVGFPVKTKEDAFRAATRLLQRGTGTVVIKMGALGVVYATQTGDGQPSPEFFPAFKVRAVDTVAAGDAFNGGLATALLEERPLPTAVRWGAAAGALSATKAGAQPSMPSRAALEEFLSQNETDR
jgi:ribokinase